jgi:hypothetical protein
MFHASHFSADNVSFPTVHSILSPTALLAEILTCYDLVRPVTCILLMRGVNDTYLVQTHNEKYILRVYTANWHSLTEILYEIDVLFHLNSNGVPMILLLYAGVRGFIRWTRMTSCGKHFSRDTESNDLLRR